MNPLTKFLKATKLFRQSFGTVPGVRLWLTLLKEKYLSPMMIFSVNVPGLKYPVFLRAHSSDIECFCQIFCRKELKNEIENPVRYIVDAGANIGLSSVFLANKYPNAAIDALEVSSKNLEILKLNANPYPNIHIVPKGLWGRSAMLRISNPSAEPWAFQVEETYKSDTQGIPAIGIKELLEIRRSKKEVDPIIDLLKVDIEGAEINVFDIDAKSWLPFIHCLMIELHDHFKPGCKEAVLSAIGDLNYSYKQQGEYHMYTFSNLSCKF